MEHPVGVAFVVSVFLIGVFALSYSSIPDLSGSAISVVPGAKIVADEVDASSMRHDVVCGEKFVQEYTRRNCSCLERIDGIVYCDR